MKQILIVDDSATNLNILKKVLEKDYQVTTINSSVQALAFLQTHPVDLLLLDLNMPEIDGFKVISKLKALGHKTPIMIISAEHDASVIARTKAIGAIDFITKPYTPEQVRERISAVFVNP